MVWYHGVITLLIIAASSVLVRRIDSSCEVPTSWQNKTWYLYRGPDDPTKRTPLRREVSVGVSELSGMTADGYAAVTTTWTCYLWNDTERLIAFKGTQIHDHIGTDGYLYTAFQLGDSFNLPVLYPRTPRDSNVYDDFVKFVDTTLNPTMKDIATKPLGTEFYFMIKTDTTASQLQTIFAPNPVASDTTTNTVITTPETTTMPETTTTPKTTTTPETTTTTTPETTHTSLPVASTTTQPSQTTQGALPSCFVSDVYKAAIIFSVVGAALIGVFLVFIVLLLCKQK